MLPNWEADERRGRICWRDGIVRACPRIVKPAYIRLLDLAQLPHPPENEEEVLCQRLSQPPRTSLSFLIFLVATVAASDQRRMGDGEWAEVDIGAAIGHVHFERRRGANWTV